MSIISSHKIKFISSTLDFLYPNPPIPLNFIPGNIYTLLIAVLLSAQTTDGQVNLVTSDIFNKASTPNELIKVFDYESLLRVVRRVGLAPTKTKNILALSNKLVEEHCGQVPNTIEELVKLPGVGPKTASVVLSQAYNEPQFAVDTHIHRLSLRWKLSKEEKDPNKVSSNLKEIFPKNEWGKRHLQFIYFGREYCTAKQHVPKDCPICSSINKNDNDIVLPTEGSLPNQELFPSKPRSKGIVFYEDRVLELNGKVSHTITASETSEILKVSPVKTEIKKGKEIVINSKSKSKGNGNSKARTIPHSTAKRGKRKGEEINADSTISPKPSKNKRVISTLKKVKNEGVKEEELHVTASQSNRFCSVL